VLKPKWGDDPKPQDIIDMATFLIDMGADLSCPAGVKLCSGFHKGSTPLDTAMWCKRKDIIDLLLSRGAELCPSSLRIAADKGDDDLIRRYIQQGGDITHDAL
jgi:ankyrin repeat protein